MPDIKENLALEHAGAVGEAADMTRAEGAALWALRLLLDDLDPQQNWGGLKKVLTPEGHYLWLCETHKQEYA